MSMAEVAKRAKVSSATVCRVLKHGNGVSDHKSRAVRQALRELGYQHVMRNRIGGIQQGDLPKPGNVVLLMPGGDHPIDMSLGIGQFLQGMENVLSDNGLHLTIAWAEESDRLRRTLSHRSVRGVVLRGA